MTGRLTRRGFLKAASAALIVGFTPRGALHASPAGGEFSPFVRIGRDGKVTVVVKHFEMGQGTATGLPTLVAEELGALLDEVEVEFAPADAGKYANLLFGIQGTGGSTSMANSYMQYRKAGAAAREMLLEAASREWGADPSALELSNGVVSGAGREAPLADFVAAASAMEAPAEPALKAPDAFTLIGNPDISRRDNDPKITGSAKFAMDVDLDGQIVAVVKRSPKFGGKVLSMDASSVDAPGFVDAVVSPAGTGVIVYADRSWAAFRARESIEVEWDFGEAEERSGEEIRADLLAAVNRPPEFVARPGAGMEGTAELFRAAPRKLEAEFFLPYLCHAPMEPLSCAIEPAGDGGVVLHDGCQMPTASQQALAAVLRLPLEKVRINTLYAGGSFGRRATMTADYTVEAALAFAMTDRTRPVKLLWSREDDIAGGAYRPAVAHKVRVGLDAEGRILVWDHRIAGKPVFKGTPFESLIVRNGVDFTSVEGAADTPYGIPNQFVGLTDHRTPVPVNWWRSVGHSHTAFAMESMMDMAARAAGIDPVAYRLEHLSGGAEDRSRLAGVLRMAAEKSGWGRPAEPGRKRGVAVHKSFGTYVAEVVEISGEGSGPIRIERVTCAVDCGVAVNPDIVKAQMEGGIGYGLGHAMRNRITLEGGEVAESNFPDYEPLRISDIGRIDVHIMPSREAPTGVGEPGVPPAAPALANAIAVDGPRPTYLPMVDSGIEFY